MADTVTKLVPRSQDTPVPDGTTPDQPVPLVDPLPGILPAYSVNLLAGAPGVGKTALSSWLLTRFRDCLPIFGRQPNPVSQVAFIGADRSWHSTGQWFAAAGYADIAHYSLQDDRKFQKKRLRHKGGRIDVLKHCLDELDKAPGGLPPNSFVQIDPIALFLGGNLIDYDACLVACSEIREICQDRQITILGTAHSGKQKADKKERYQRLQDRILGSAALFGYTDTQMYLAAPEETGEKHYTFLWHPHHSPPELFPLGRDASGLFVPYSDSVGAVEENALLAAIPWDEDGIAFGELVTQTLMARATVHRHLQTCLASGVVEKAGYGKYRRPTLN